MCFTLMANMGEGGHNTPVIKDRWGIRKLTLVNAPGCKATRTIGWRSGEHFLHSDLQADRQFGDHSFGGAVGGGVHARVIEGRHPTKKAANRKPSFGGAR